MDDLPALLAATRARLDGVPEEGLGSFVERGRVVRALGARPRIVRVGAARHLGVLLVGDDLLAATGTILRAAEEARRGYAAESQRQRAELRAMAFRGGFAEGETFHLDWRPVDVDRVAAGGADGPLSWRDGRLLVRWSPAGFLRPLDEYLDEQVRLAVGLPD